MFFRRKFGPNWKTHVQNNCGLSAHVFDAEFVRFVDPLWGFLWVELYAISLGFTSPCDVALKRWQESVLRNMDASPEDDPNFDHRLRPVIRATSSTAGRKRASAYWTHPDLVPFLEATRRPFNPLTYAPAWLRTEFPSMPHPVKMARGKKAKKVALTEQEKKLSSKAWRLEMLRLFKEIHESSVDTSQKSV